MRSNRNVASFIKELVLELPAGEEVGFRAGGYIQIEAPPHAVDYRNFAIDEKFREDWDRFNLWQYRSEVKETIERAYSMANYPEEKGIIMLNVRIATPPPPGIPRCRRGKCPPTSSVSIRGTRSPSPAPTATSFTGIQPPK